MLTSQIMERRYGKLKGTDAIIAQNIDRFIMESGKTRAQLAEAMDLPTPNLISQLRHGHKAAGKDMVSRFAKVLGRKPADFYKEAPPRPPSVVAEAGTEYAVRESIPFIIRVVQSKRFEEPQAPQVRESDYLCVPIVEPRVAAGAPEVVSSEQLVDVAFIHRRALGRRSVADCLCTYVVGDSMFPLLRDGAIVCIDTKARPVGQKVPRGSIWAIRKGDGAVIKHLQFGDGVIVLLSANPDYPPEIVQDPEAIIGRVVWTWMNL